MEKLILIKYGEMTTKKKNRHQFIKKLEKNIKNKIKEYDYEIITKRDRMYIISKELDEIIDLLKDVFGIYAMAIAYRMKTDLKNIKENALKLTKEKDFKSFKVETKRSYKKFDITSMEVSRIVGGYILKKIDNIKVDVKNPELICNIEIRKEYSYIYFENIKGAKGFPGSTQQKALLMLSGGIDSPVAGYMAMKRGIEIECIYFESPPYTSLQALNKVRELVRILSKYQKKIKLHIVPFTKMQREIYKNIDSTYGVTIMRRMMYRISEKIAIENRAIALVNGECIGQVASQTLTSMSCINEVTKMPILRPLVTFDKEGIIKLAKTINTYETSILPFEDCCTIFVDKHPVINPTLDMCKKYEENFKYKNEIKEILKNIKTETIEEKKEKFTDLL